MTKAILVGAHVSIGGGLYKAVERAEEIGATTMQIFTKSARTWYSKKLTDEVINQFKGAVDSSNISGVTVHGSYLINIGSPNASAAKKSTTALQDEFDRCEQLGIPYLVFHPGSHLGSGEDECLERIAENLKTVLTTSKKRVTTILLETMAGQGTNVGYKFEHLKKIISLCSNSKRIGVCFDTCHVLAAGYDISSEKEYKKVMLEFDKVIGFDRLCAMHINDSKEACGSKKDRHASLGQGEIPLETFRLIMNDRRLKKIPKILETPGEGAGHTYEDEIALLKSMVR